MKDVSSYQETLSKFSKSPFNGYFSIYEVHDEFKIFNDVKELANGQKVSLTDLILNLKHLMDGWSVFRPEIIDRHHPYWGTVKLMDSLFYILNREMNINMKVIFSNIGSVMPSYYLNPEPEWSRIIKDLGAIIKAIYITMGMNAVNGNYFIVTKGKWLYKKITIRAIQLQFSKHNLSNLSVLDIQKLKIKEKEFDCSSWESITEIIFENCPKRR